jgi:hypothetical protein
MSWKGFGRNYEIPQSGQPVSPLRSKLEHLQNTSLHEHGATSQKTTQSCENLKPHTVSHLPVHLYIIPHRKRGFGVNLWFRTLIKDVLTKFNFRVNWTDWYATHPTPLRLTVILSFSLHLDLQIGLFLWNFHAKTVCSFVSPLHSTHLIHHILVIITVMILETAYPMWFNWSGQHFILVSCFSHICYMPSSSHSCYLKCSVRVTKVKLGIGSDLLVRGHIPRWWLWSQTDTGAWHSMLTCPDLTPANNPHVCTPV